MKEDTPGRDIIAETSRLERSARDLTVDLFGVADLRKFRTYGGLDISILRFPFAVSVGIRLSDSIVDRITVDDPTPEYAHHYKVVNAFLDEIALRISSRIQTEGHDALPIPASQIIRSDLHQGAISHKAIAALAGLGWIGKSQLLINPTFGPRLRLASILTTMPLKSGNLIKNECGECDVCVRTCPTHAIKPVKLAGEEWVREAVFDPDVCYRRLIKFREDPRYGVSICGVCVKACPVGSKTAK